MMPFWPFLLTMRNKPTFRTKIRNRKKLDQNGFTYVLALVIIMIMGIMLGAVGQSWKTIMQRDREEELLFRGTQYKDAITRWYKIRKTPLRDLNNLVLDPTSLTKVRYLRRLYTDPMTNKEWTVISDANKGISGVASTSPLKPFKVGGFPEDLKDLSDKSKYSDWQFVYAPTKKGVTAAAKPGAQPAKQ